MGIIEKLLLVFLFLSSSLLVAQSDTLSAQKSPVLDGAHGIRFGMGREEIVGTMMDNYGAEPTEHVSERDYAVVEFRLPQETGITKLRIFVDARGGAFWIEEEIELRWNLQERDQDNLRYHEKRMEAVLRRLRENYGKEAISEELDFGSRETSDDFVNATWGFAENRWIHVIFEPQDWGLFPEKNKILVIHRDSNRDPRSN